MNVRHDNAHESRRVLVLQHAKSETLGTIEDALKSAGFASEYVRTFEDQPVPENPGASAALIVMGGPMGVYETKEYPFLVHEMRLIESFIQAQLPILGVCLGSQLIAATLGAKVRKGVQKEIGWHAVQLSRDSERDAVWKDQPSHFTAYHWHGDIFDLPKDAVALASSEITPVQAYRHGDRIYGLLFHLEVTQNQIRQMLSEFAAEIQEENLSAQKILDGAGSFLPPMQKIGAAVFNRWTTLIGAD